MYEIELTGGAVLKMPESLKEITVEQYCEFLQGVTDFIDWQNKQAEAETDLLSPAYQLERLHRMSKMIQDFCTAAPGCGLTDVFQLPTGDYMKSLKDTFSVNDLAQIDLDRSEGTLYTLWANIFKVISQVELIKPGEDQISFEWKGETFHVKPVTRDRMTGRELPPDLSTQEAVEVLELRRKAAAMFESKKFDPKNIKWELLHRQLAILALKAGEGLPEDDLEFERFASDRAAHFIGIDADTALRVDFFLGGSLTLLNPTLTLISFSTLLDRKALQMQKPGRSSKRKTRQSASG